MPEEALGFGRIVRPISLNRRGALPRARHPGELGVPG